MSFKIVQKKNIPSLIVEQIRKKILTGDLAAGERLPPELELTKEFGVSRSSVREAIKILEGFGIVERQGRGGTFVRQITIDDLAAIYTPKPEIDNLLDLLETREILELKAIELAIERADDNAIKELLQTVDWMNQDVEKVRENDIVFHLTLARITQNQVLSRIIHSIKNQMDNANSHPIVSDDIESIYFDHQNIIKAISERNVSVAQKIMKDHFTRIRKKIISMSDNNTM